MAERRVVKIIPPILCESDIKVLGFNLERAPHPHGAQLKHNGSFDAARRVILLFQLAPIYDRY